MPNKPTIAVLPFTNLSGDPEQEYFSNGITDDILTDLSKFSGLFVIARSSSFAYKGAAVKVQQVGKELGVRYVLEGSIRKITDHIRINVQLIDATTGHQVWSEHYDDLSAIFSAYKTRSLRPLWQGSVEVLAGNRAGATCSHRESHCLRSLSAGLGEVSMCICGNESRSKRTSPTAV